MTKPNERYFQIDWFDYKSMLKSSIIEDKTITLNTDKTTRRFREVVGNSGEWRGYSKGQLERWISEGYVPPEMVNGLENLIPPMREKSRTIWNDDGDEFHVDLAYSGVDNFMSSQSKREVIPGVKIEAGIMFSCGTSHEVVNAYTVWICKVLYSLEKSGIDTQLTLDFPSWGSVIPKGGRESYSRSFSDRSTLYHSVVRVKKENEVSDFQSWSAMVSPASLRNFGFGAICLHANDAGGTPSDSMGRGVPERRDWALKWDSERRVLVIENEYNSRRFPEERLTSDLRNVLKTISGKSQ